MAQLVSTWSKNVQSVPNDYVMPPESRAGDFIKICNDIPVINLQDDRSEIIQQILKACNEFGLFQVINHEVSDKIMADMDDLYDEFFNMFVEEKEDNYSEKLGKGYSLHTGSMNYAKEDVHLWKDTLRHSCHPIEEHAPSWPDKPARYRDEVGKYATEVRKMGINILDLITEGLGLNKGYFNEINLEQTMVVNHYPPCPDPSLAMGIGCHGDIGLITFIQQNQYGLQIQKDGIWMGVDPIPNAFTVILGYHLEVVSNGKLKSVEHRGVVNSSVARTSIGTFMGMNLDVVVEPAKEVVSSTSPPKFKSVKFNEFLASYLDFYLKPGPRNGTPLDAYRV